mgnify:CR=1 FL=1
MRKALSLVLSFAFLLLPVTSPLSVYAADKSSSDSADTAESGARCWHLAGHRAGLGQVRCGGDQLFELLAAELCKLPGVEDIERLGDLLYSGGCLEDGCRGGGEQELAELAGKEELLVKEVASVARPSNFANASGNRSYTVSSSGNLANSRA